MDFFVKGIGNLNYLDGMGYSKIHVDFFPLNTGYLHEIQRPLVLKQVIVSAPINWTSTKILRTCQEH